MIFSKKIANIPRGRISYREAGNGPCLFLMHGIGGNTRSWRAQLGGLCHKFRIVAWDAPGYGESTIQDPTLSNYADTAFQFLDALEVEKSYVLGHSMGGVIAQGLAGLEPKRIQKLVLSSTFTGYARPFGATLTAGLNARLEDIKAMTSEQFGLARALNMVSKNTSSLIREEVASIAAEVEYLGLRSACEMLNCSDTRPLLPKLKMPVLVISGIDDNIEKPNQSNDMADLIPFCRRVELQQAAHASYLEVPTNFNRTFVDLLE